jgi:H+/gluconate symporter-like permease
MELTDYFGLGQLGAFTLAGKFFLLFAAGAVFGRVMGDSHAAASVALALVRKLGARRALWITTLACALLTYGGVVVFVVIFAMYPLGLRLLQEADVFAGGIGYLEWQRGIAEARGEGFEPGPQDRIEAIHDSHYPHWTLAALPLAIVLLTIILPRVLTGMLPESVISGSAAPVAVLRFANSQPVVWPSIALFAGSLAALLLFPAVRRHGLDVFGAGTRDSIMPLINTAAVIGLGGVITRTDGFQSLAQWAVQSEMPPLLSMFLSISVVSAVTLLMLVATALVY